MGRCACLGAVAMAALVSAAGPAAAKGPPTVRFTYDRAPNAADCPDRDSVLDAVRARLGFDPFREPAEIAISASVSRAGEELTAAIVLSDGRAQGAGERRLVSRRADCSELASAMELALSIAIDPLSISREPAAPRASLPIVVMAPSPPPPPPPPAPTQPSTPKFFSVSGGALGSLGASLAPAAGFQAGFGLASASWSISLEGRADLPTSKDVEGGRITTSVLAGTLAPCLVRGPFAGCLLASAMALRGSGQDLVDAQQLTTSMFAVGARVAFEIPTSSTFGIRAYLDVLGPIARTTLKVGGDAVWTSPPVSGAFGLAGVVRFR